MLTNDTTETFTLTGEALVQALNYRGKFWLDPRNALSAKAMSAIREQLAYKTGTPHGALIRSVPVFVLYKTTLRQ
jgi:hypothetical protein